MPEKVTIMVLTVDLQCKKCCKKVKKALSKFPEIQEQKYDEKQNTVTIKVVSCCPEKLRNKICCKGAGSIKTIEIKPPEEPPKPVNKTTNLIIVPVPVVVPVPGYPPYYPIGMCSRNCCWGCGGWPCYCGVGLPRCYDGYYGSCGDGAGCTIM